MIKLKEGQKILDVDGNEYLIEKGDAVHQTVLQESRVEISLDQFVGDLVEKVEGEAEYVTVYTESPISRLDFGKAQIKGLMNGLSLRSEKGGMLLEISLDKELEYGFDSTGVTRTYRAFNPKTKWQIVIQVSESKVRGVR